MFTYNDNPVVGQPGNGTENWGEILNDILDQLKANTNTLLSDLNTHQHNDLYSLLDHNHFANEIGTGIGGGQYVEDTLLEICGQDTVPISLKDLKTWYDTMNPDISGVSVSASFSDRYNGLEVVASCSPSVYVKGWKLILKKDGLVIHEESGNHSVFWVNKAIGLADGDNLSIQVIMYTGIDSSVSSSWYSHVYHPPVNPEIGNLEAQLANLTIANFIDSFIQNDAAMTALANYVHGSNLLATKVANIIQT
ncbi:MAG: hypothetical protein PWQ09_1200 [Candidatus Cloacimonadota bacterium]|nr:hypothetical protein [Candidatus Cloacimonadota bacterium]